MIAGGTKPPVTASHALRTSRAETRSIAGREGRHAIDGLKVKAISGVVLDGLTSEPAEQDACVDTSVAARI